MMAPQYIIVDDWPSDTSFYSNYGPYSSVTVNVSNDDVPALPHRAPTPPAPHRLFMPRRQPGAALFRAPIKAGGRGWR